MTANDPRNDLDWLAFRYVADELDGSEVEAFENRLLDDQPAREAVARAVELVAAVAGAGASSGLILEPLYRYRWRTRVILAGVAASLVAAVGLALRRPGERVPEAGSVAQAWSDLRTPASEPEWFPTGEPADSAPGGAEAITTERTPPSWLLAATEPVADDASRRSEP